MDSGRAQETRRSSTWSGESNPVVVKQASRNVLKAEAAPSVAVARC